MKGIFQHRGERHLCRYLNEFDFRHSNRVALGVNDVERAHHALKGAVGFGEEALSPIFRIFFYDILRIVLHGLKGRFLSL
jgi:hypothetical protein